jgi:hypothetical protein
MAALRAKVTSLATRRTRIRGPVIGRVVESSAGGLPVVEIPGPVPSRAAARSVVPSGVLAVGAEVVLVFEQDDEARPIIVGLLSDPATQAVGFALPPGILDELLVDRRKLVLNARDAIVLRCGKASVTLQANGAIVIKGTRLVSRSSGCNKIKGASVQIN